MNDSSAPPDEPADRPDDLATSAGGPTSSRRQFLKIGTLAVGAGVGCAVAVPALAYVAFPLNNEVTRGADVFIDVGKREQFSADTPTRVDLYADRVDAWNRAEKVRLGSAWVLDRDGELVAYSTVCPHLGCAVNFDADKEVFICPCHDSAFGLDGAINEGPAPRGLDALELDVRGPDALVAIRFQRFKQGTADKVPV